MRPFDLAYLKRTSKFAAITSGLEAASLLPHWLRPAGMAGRGIILTLHHVRPRERHAFRPNEFLSITPEFLDEALTAALSCGLVPIRLEDLPARLSCPSDKNAYLAVTLDDGYRDNAEFAAPVFRKHGTPYTIFLTSGFVERRHAPWWEVVERLLRRTDRVEFDFGLGPEVIVAETVDEKMGLFDRFTSFVRRLQEDVAIQRINDAARRIGIDPLNVVDELVMTAGEIGRLAASDGLAGFGAHSVTHCNLKRIGDERLVDEIIGSMDAVERYTGVWPKAFAYPYGWHDAVGPREMNAVEKAGFAVGVTTQPGVLRSPETLNPLGMRRVSLNGYYQKPRYVRAFVSGVPFRFAY